MLLVGQYDSPFVRRVAVAMTLYRLPFEHRPWSVWSNAEELSALNPLRRVPTLQLDDGECLFESFAILDALDEMVGPERALIPASGALRRKVLRTSALATGAADKIVSLFYESLLREQPSQVWSERCRHQISDALSVLEREREQAKSTWWCGSELGHADIAVACMLRFLREALPGAFDVDAHPNLSRHAARCEALSAFQAVVQPLTVAVSR